MNLQFRIILFFLFPFKLICKSVINNLMLCSNKISFTFPPLNLPSVNPCQDLTLLLSRFLFLPSSDKPKQSSPCTQTLSGESAKSPYLRYSGAGAQDLSSHQQQFESQMPKGQSARESPRWCHFGKVQVTQG